MAVFRRSNPNQKFDELKRASANARLPYDKDVLLNLAFYKGEQYVEWASDASTIRHIPRPEGFEHTPRPVANKIMHFVAQEHAMALQAKPTVDVLPSSEDPLDLSRAAVALAYLRWLADPTQAHFDAQLSEATLWALVGGEGFLKWTYNDKKDRGDITSCSPLDIYLDPYTKRFSDARYIIHSQFMDVEQVYDIYDQEVPPAGVEKTDALRSSLLREMGQAPVLSGVTVNELWMRPSRRYPEGLFVVWAGTEQLVKPDKFPYAHKQLPFTQIGSIPRPGAPHYNCAVSYLRAPQTELNKYHAQRIMVREAFASPKWWIDSVLELEQDPDDSPRQVLRGNSMGGTLKPEIIQPTVFAGGDEGQWITEEMMHTVGLHEVSQAQVPGRVEAAKAIEMLKESDSSRLAELTRTIKDAITVGFWQQLQLAKQYVSAEKMVVTYSREGLPEVRRFKSEAITPGTRVNVTMGTGLARSRAAREDQVYRMVELGIIKDPETAAELLDIPVGVITPTKSFDIRLARNENYTIAGGAAVTPNSWDDHPIHLREHNNFRKTSEYLTLSEETKTKFEYHCQTHEELYDSDLARTAQRQMVMQGMQQAPPEGQEPQEESATPVQG